MFKIFLVACLFTLAILLTLACFVTVIDEKTVRYGCGDVYLSTFFNCDRVTVKGTFDFKLYSCANGFNVHPTTCFCDVTLLDDDVESEIDCCLPEENYFVTLNVGYEVNDTSMSVMLCDYDTDECELMEGSSGSSSVYFLSNSTKLYYLKKVSRQKSVVNVNVSVSYVNTDCELFHSTNDPTDSVVYLGNDVIGGYNGYVLLEAEEDCRIDDYVDVVNTCSARVDATVFMLYSMLPITYIMFLLSCWYSCFGYVKKKCTSKKILYNDLPCTERCKKCNNCKILRLSDGSVGTSGFVRTNEAYDFDEKTMTCTVSSLPNLTETLKRRPVSDSIESLRSSMDVSFVAEAPCGSEIEVCKSSSGYQAN